MADDNEIRGADDADAQADGEGTATGGHGIWWWVVRILAATAAVLAFTCLRPL